MSRAALVLAAALGLAGCGGGSSSTTTSAPRPMGAPPATKTTNTQPSVRTPETPTTSTSPEQKPGGAGDETPAHFDASLTGRGGRISPRQVSVGPFISVRVLLRSADGQIYQLTVNGKTLKAQGSKRAELTLPGLKPGQSYTLEQPAGGAPVKIAANAEPGP